VATAKARPADFTGRERERLARENAEQLEQRANEISLINAAAEEKKATEIVDATTGKTAPVIVDEIQTVDVELEQKYEIIQVLDDIEQMTFGAGNLFDFKRGVKYKVTVELANHLREKGYIY
jgi:type III secretion system FlhB-like substrate exporter